MTIMSKLDLSVKLASLTLKNPIITASGTCGTGEELEGYFDLNQLGALTVKGITVKPSTGNPTPRIAETPGGILNSIGLENPGIEEFIKTKLDIIKKYRLPVLVNISGYSIEDFSILAEKLSPIKEIAGLEVNVSCPNIAGGGLAFGTDSGMVYQITREVKNTYSGPVIVKLSPNVTDIVEIARAAEEGGADAVSLINTVLGMAIDLEREEPVLGNTFGGLSGPAIKPIALRMVYQVASSLEIPVIGMGGIMSGRDALEFILAGASAVAVGTATLVDPQAPIRILKELKDYLINRGYTRLAELQGKAIKKSL